ncbi:uncharacterized protein LOC144991861 [Oryzias latipes]
MSSTKVKGSIPPRSSCSADSLLPTALPHQMTLDPARLRACSSQLGSARRRKREMIPADQKDATYWAKRNKNNEAAKRSREKRRFQDLLMGGQLLALTEENAQLRAQLLSLQYRTGLSMDGNPPAPPANLPPLFRGGLWGSAAVMETGMYHYDDTISCFSPARRVGVFDAVTRHYCMTPQGQGPLNGHISRPPTGPLVLSAGVNRIMDAEIDAQRKVSPSEDVSMQSVLPPRICVPPGHAPPWLHRAMLTSELRVSLPDSPHRL